MNIKSIFYSCILILSLSSCEDVIELDLKNTDPQIVIEGVLNADEQSINVSLTQSNGFYDSNELTIIEDATIYLEQADGVQTELMYQGMGVYAADNLNVVTNDQVQLEVMLNDGTTYEASSTVPHSVAIDSLDVVSTNFSPGGGFIGGGSDDPVYQIFMNWQDVAGVESFYRIRAIKNDTLLANVYALTDDIGADGASFSRPFFDTFESNDEVEMQLLAIDQFTYDYFSDLAAIQGQGPNSSNPFNPTSNFTNGALGYFGVIRQDEIQLTIP